MKHALVGACILMFLLVFFGVLAVNALAMVISPRAWFELPEWLDVSGSMRLRKAKYSSGWGAFQVRFLGLFFLARTYTVPFMMMRHTGN